MPEKRLLRALLDSMSTKGFSRRNLVAYKDGEAFVTLVEFQRSRWNETYFVNIGFWLKALGAVPEKLPLHKCHYYGRAGEEIAAALAFEEPFEGDRERAILCYLEALAGELATLVSASDLVDWIRTEKLKAQIVLPDAQVYLGL